MTEESAHTGQLSPDGYWWWDGAQWVSAVSPDGHWRWDGSAWVVNEVQPRYASPISFEPTPDTRRVQVAVTGYFILSAVLGSFTIPGTMSSSFRRSFEQSMSAGGTVVDRGFIDGMVAAFVVGTFVIGAVWIGLMLLGTWRRWRWVYYLIMALGALQVFGLLSNALSLAGVGSYGLVPRWIATVNILAGAVYVALAGWMLTLWRRYKTAWATRPEPL